jgi:lipoyl(octanoyl) transferase
LSAISWKWRGSVPYRQAWAEQRQHRDQIIEGSGSEEIWLLEHDPPVITTGRRSVHGLPTEKELAARGVELFRTERGGLATWHGPGQIMAYLLIRAQARGLGVRGMVSAIERAIIRWLETWDVKGYRRDGYPGIWAEGHKICAIGLHFRRGVSMHGIALNLDPDLHQFQQIQPCGITDAWVTSVAELTGKRPTASQVAPAIGEALSAELSLSS